MTRTLLALSLALLLAAPALAQDDAPKPQPPQPPLEVQLSDQVGDLLRAIRDGKQDVAKGILAGWKPTQEALAAVLTEEGQAALGEKLLAQAEETFKGTPAEIAERLGLDVTKLHVTVFTSSTEGLESMDQGSIAALHFAAALRHTSRLFQKQKQFYSVMMLEPEAPEDATGSYLQVFVHTKAGFVYLGKLWRLDGEQPQKPMEPQKPVKPGAGSGKLGEPGQKKQ